MKVTRREFDGLVREAVAGIPATFGRYLDELIIEVADQPDHGTARRAGVRRREDLLGLYQGVPRPDRQVEAPTMPDRITLYQVNIQRVSRTRANLIDQVRKTVLHEIGHHFGLDEEDLADLGYD